jgi:hypothetical protein
MGRIKLLAGIILALAVPAAALAANPAQNITLSKGDIHTGTYFGWGQTVTVDGDVDGDVVCGAQTVIINGKVNGDVLCGAQTITVNGDVVGSIRAGAQVANVNGSVGRNVTVATQEFTLSKDAKVAGELAVAGQTVVLNGPVDQAVYVASQSLVVNSTTGKNLTAYVESLKLGSDAQVAGNLDYTSDQTLNFDKSKVKGDVNHHLPTKPQHRQSTVGERLSGLVYWVLAGLVGTMLAIWLIPRLVRSVTSAMMLRWKASLGWGALALIGGPIILFMLALTVIGLPVAAVIGILWAVALTVAVLFAGVAVGRLAWQRDETSQRSLALAALVGVPLVMIASWLPIIGPLVGLAAVAWALGGMLLALAHAQSLD